MILLVIGCLFCVTGHFVIGGMCLMMFALSRPRVK